MNQSVNQPAEQDVNQSLQETALLDGVTSGTPPASLESDTTPHEAHALPDNATAESAEGRSLRVAFLVEGMSSSGVDTSTQLLAKAMRAYGHHVVIFSPWQERAADESDPSTAPLPPIRIKSDQPTYLSVPVSWSVYERFRKEHFDIIHVHTSTTVNLIAWQMSSVLGLPIVYTYHTMTVEYAHYLGKFLSRWTGVVEPAIELFDRMVCNGADAIVAPSRKAYDYLEHISVRPEVTVIPNGIDLSRFRPEPSDFLRQRLNIAPERPIAIWVGRLNEEKRPMLACQLFARALKDAPQAVLVYVGDGALRADLEKAAEAGGHADSIRVLGPVKYDEMPLVYQSADLWISTSLSEVHPMVALEAAACGRAAVAMRDPALQDIVLEGESGLLADDDDQFVANLVRLLNDSDERARMSECAASHALEFSVERTAQRMIQLYARVVESNPRPHLADFFNLATDGDEPAH